MPRAGFWGFSLTLGEFLHYGAHLKVSDVPLYCLHLLYYHLSLLPHLHRREVALAKKLREAFEAKGIEFYYPSPTNQLFPILTNRQIEKLSENYSFSVQQPLENGAVVRFCTGWTSREEDVDRLIKDIERL